MNEAFLMCAETLSEVIPFVGEVNTRSTSSLCVKPLKEMSSCHPDEGGQMLSTRRQRGKVLPAKVAVPMDNYNRGEQNGAVDVSCAVIINPDFERRSSCLPHALRRFSASNRDHHP